MLNFIAGHLILGQEQLLLVKITYINQEKQQMNDEGSQALRLSTKNMLVQ